MESSWNEDVARSQIGLHRCVHCQSALSVEGETFHPRTSTCIELELMKLRTIDRVSEVVRERM